MFTIPGTLPSLNDYVNACRANKRLGAKMSNDAHILCKYGMLKLAGKKLPGVWITFRWIEKNRRRDKDNIAFAKKFILDAMQEMDIIENDGWNEIHDFRDIFSVDKYNPRIEVTMEYQEKEGNENGYRKTE